MQLQACAFEQVHTFHSENPQVIIEKAKPPPGSVPVGLALPPLSFHHVDVSSYTCTHAHAHARMHMHMHMHVRTRTPRTHTHMHTQCTHTHTHTHT